MKINKVTCHILQSKVERPFTSARGWLYSTRSSCIVEVTADDGLTGWGECYGPAAVNKSLIETQYAPRVIGRDPFDVEVVWEDLYNRIKDYGAQGFSITALSGIDIALWDLMGEPRASRSTSSSAVPIASTCRPMQPASTSSTWTGWSRKRWRKRWSTRRRASAPSK
jgi:hypothetical protein